MAASGTPDIMAFKSMNKLMNQPNNAEGVTLLFFEVKKLGKEATVIQAAKMQELERASLT